MINCPICSTQLQPIEVAPCFDCGHAPRELDECIRGEHEYQLFELWGREIVLCDFCDADFGSYYPNYWGLPKGPLPGYPLRLLRKLENAGIGQDLYCPSCDHRLAFLLFRSYAMAHNAT